ncbi:unnamed protein product [Linum trigynum]|uniref:Uncharacterized protein n=1 Tax=Linum trigynum TaxID=586398 RepID=A0AAV2GUH4_9ROSI
MQSPQPTAKIQLSGPVFIEAHYPKKKPKLRSFLRVEEYKRLHADTCESRFIATFSRRRKAGSRRGIFGRRECFLLFFFTVITGLRYLRLKALHSTLFGRNLVSRF